MEMTENSPLEPEKSYPSLQDTDQILTVKELAPDERPRERALKYGISSLSVAELLALILRTGLDKTTRRMVRSIIKQMIKLGTQTISENKKENKALFKNITDTE